MELKSKITEKKKSVEGLSSIFKLSEERINEFSDRLIQIMQSEEKRKRGKERKKMDRASEKCGTALSAATYL